MVLHKTLTPARAARLASLLALCLAALPACSTGTPQPKPANAQENEPKAAPKSENAALPAASAVRGQPITALATTAPAPTQPVVLGYFTNWAHHRKAPCDFRTENVDAKLFSHINYAFALVKPSDDKETYDLMPSDPEDQIRLYKEVVGLKEKNPDLKVLLSVGGWSFNDKPTEWIFSAMAETPERRGSFIRNSIAYLRTFGFDGLDIDWEFPAVADRGGRPMDTENFTSLLREFRAQMEEEAKTSGKPELMLTIASPAGPFFYQHQQLDKIHSYLNFINVMTYDYHGSWEQKTGANAPLTGEEVSIDSTIDAYLKAGVPANKLVMGMATYARGWGGVTEGKPGAEGKEKGPVGPCGEESFSAHQVETAIKAKEYQEKWDAVTQTPYAFSKEKKAYLTYDNKKSIALKLDLLQQKQLAGAMFWAIDLDDFKGGYPIISQVNERLRPATPAKVPSSTPAAKRSAAATTTSASGSKSAAK